MMLYYTFLFWLAQLPPIRCATSAQWRSRSIYQVMTDRYALANMSTTAPCDAAAGLYCGGSYEGITKNLDYIQNMGFDAVWISPITAQETKYTEDHESYHGYWPNNLYELNSRFGNASSLRALSDELHRRGMYLMVDVVLNHMAWAGSHTTVQYNTFIPFNDSSYFHPYCSVKTPGSDQLTCWQGDDVVPLVDLRTEDTRVRDVFSDWIAQIVYAYNIDGLRLDAAGNMEASFFPSFGAAAKVFMMGEVYTGLPSYACPYQQVMPSITNYPVYFDLIPAFGSTNSTMQSLTAKITAMKDSCSTNDTSLLGSFSENHDQPRFASYTTDIAAAYNVLAYTMLTDGIPMIYQGQEQRLNGSYDPLNREAIWLTGFNQNATLYQYIKSLNALRKEMIRLDGSYLTYKAWVVNSTKYTLSLRKGNMTMVLTNQGVSSTNQSVNLANYTTGFTPKMALVDIFSCENLTAGDDGSMSVVLQKGMPRMLFARESIDSSKFCYQNRNVVNGTSNTGGSGNSGGSMGTSSNGGYSDTSKLGGGAIAGIVLGVLAGLALLGAAILFWRRKQRRTATVRPLEKNWNGAFHS